MARSEYRDRDGVEVSVLDALVAHADDGLTVFDVRATVEADIDQIETALAALQSDDLIEVEENGGTVRIYPADRVVPDPEEQTDDRGSVFDQIRDVFDL